MNVRRIFALAVGALFLGQLGSTVSAADVAQEAVSSVEMASERIADCRNQATKKGMAQVDVLFVIDTSSSLKVTDPTPMDGDPSRVRALKSVISMLNSSDDSNQSSQTQVRVNFLDFGSRVSPSFAVSGWQPIKSFDERGLKDFGRKNTAIDTDYLGAFVDEGGVIDQLRSSITESDCQIVLLLTDGEFDIDEKSKASRSFEWLESETGNGEVSGKDTARKAKSIGEKLFCGKNVAGGQSLADQVRSLDSSGSLTVVGVGLNSGKQKDFSLLERLLQDPSCGENESTVGYMIEVSSADDLAGYMRNAVYSTVPFESTCGLTSGAKEQTLYFAEPLQQANLFLRASAGVHTVRLKRVDKKTESSIDIYKNGEVSRTSTIEGVTINPTLLDDAPTIEVGLGFGNPTSNWVGKWILEACTINDTKAEVDADLVVRGCIGFDLAAESAKLIAGRDRNISLILRRCGTDATNLSTVAAISMNAKFLVGGVEGNSDLEPSSAVVKIPYAPTAGDLAGAPEKTIKLQILEVSGTYSVLDGQEPVVLEWETTHSDNTFDVLLRMPPKTPYVESLGCGRMENRSRIVKCDFRAKADDADGTVKSTGLTLVPSKYLGQGISLKATPSERFPLKVKQGQIVDFSYTIDLEGIRKNLEEVSQGFELSFDYETDGVPTVPDTLTSYFVIEPDATGEPAVVRAVVFALLGLVLSLVIFVLARILFAALQVPKDGMLWGGAMDVQQCDPEAIRTSLMATRVNFDPLALDRKLFGLREVNELGLIGDCNITLNARAGWRLFSELGYVSATHPEFTVIGSGGTVNKGRSGRTSLSLVSEWWLIIQGPIDGVAPSVDELRSRLERLPGKLVFVSAVAEPPRTYFTDLGHSISNELSSGLDAVANYFWVKSRDEGTIPGGPNEPVIGPRPPEI